MSQNDSQSDWKPGSFGQYTDRADKLENGPLYRPEFLEYIQLTLKIFDNELLALNLDIHCELTPHPDVFFSRITANCLAHYYIRHFQRIQS